MKILADKKVILSFLTAGCAALLAGCSSQEEAQETAPAMEEYVSEDGALSVNLPGDDWQIDEDDDTMKIFSSSDGLVMITHTENASDEMYPQSEEDIQMILEIEGYASEGYEVTEFTRSEVAELKSYQAVVHYTEEDAVYSWGILNGMLMGDQVYMASAMVVDESEAMLEAMKSSVYGYSWKTDEEEKKTVTPELTEEPTPEPTEEVTPEPTEEPTPEPTAEPTPEPTAEPTPEATPEPTAEPTPEPTAVPQEEITPVSRSGYCHSPAYIRNAPNNSSGIVGSVEEGQTVTITGEIRNWYQIAYGGGTAYVCKDYIR
ncbi:MAG: SH3 domain-containing protein [Ruminococcus sp.]|jgi:cell division septation protein DedD